MRIYIIVYAMKRGEEYVLVSLQTCVSPDHAYSLTGQCEIFHHINYMKVCFIDKDLVWVPHG